MDLGWKARLDLVVRPVSIGLVLVQFIFLFGALLGMLWIISNQLQGISETGSKGSSIASFAAIGFFLIAVLAASIIQFPKIMRSPVSKIPSNAKRLIFLACGGVSRASRGVNHWCMLIASDFKKAQLLHPTQTEVVSKILENIKVSAGTVGSYDAITAPSGFGKTRCITLILEALVHSKDYHNFVDNCYFYDFAGNLETQELFLQRLGRLTHSKALVFVDNFHRAKPDTIQETTDFLLQRRQNMSENHFLFLAQPTVAWRLQGDCEVKLFSEARKNDNLHEIRGFTPSDLLNARLSTETRKRMVTAKEQAQTPFASIAEVHSALIDQMAEQRDQTFATTIRTHLFDNTEVNEPLTPRPPELLDQVVGIACALALHRGVFSKKEFKNAFKGSASFRGGKRVINPWRAFSLLRRLSRIGLIPKSSMPGRLYVLHEQLAEHLRDTLGKRNVKFEQSFKRALLWRLDTNMEGTLPSLQWLGGVELHEVGRLKKYFDRAMIEGGLHPMVRRLNANIAHFDDPIALYQLGVVQNKMGEFQKAKETLRSLESKKLPVDLKNRSAIASLEAEHDEGRLNEVKLLSQDVNASISLSARYWFLHMKAHSGMFSPDSLLDLATEYTNLFRDDDIGNDYLLSILASRIYFDACRHVFLVRSNLAQKLAELNLHPINRTIEQTDPCLTASRILYFQAHVLCFLVIPELAIFSNRLKPEQLPISIPRDYDLTELCNKSAQSYKNARDEFSVYGNRECLFLKGDILNSMIQHPQIKVQEAKILLNEYTHFIDESNFPDLASYPKIYAFRLALRQWLHELSGGFESQQGTNGDDFHALAKQSLYTAHNLDQKSQNKYGIWRARFYTALFNSISVKDEKIEHRPLASQLQELALEAQTNGYLGDAEFINRLIKSDSLTIGTVFKVLIYHPFVHQ